MKAIGLRPFFQGDDEPRAYVYLRMVDHEVENKVDRTQTPQYAQREPRCVPTLEADRAVVEITNAGNLASDLVVLDFEVRFCTFDGHQADEGFTVDHAGELYMDPLEQFQTLTVVNPGETVRLDLQWPPEAGVVNMYFRARVSTLWEESPEWNLRDRQVTECYRKIA